MIVSVPHLTAETLPALAESFRRYGGRYIQAYPSAIERLGRLLEMSPDVHWPRVDGILLSSERLSAHQRELLAQVFGCPILDLYGLSERVAIAASSPSTPTYTVSPAYSFVELLRADGIPIDQTDPHGEIVGTTFHNMVAPLIRYRTGDLAVPEVTDSDVPPGQQGWSSIQGRVQEFLVGSDGHVVSSTYLNLHSTALRGVAAYQYQQSRKGRVELLVAPVRSADDIDLDSLGSELTSRLGPQFVLSVRLVSHIPSTPSGKSRVIDQRLPDPAADTSP
jgi:phenylacetate-CoA ligase